MSAPYDATAVVQEAERLGYDSVWTGEAYGSDAISPLAWLGSQTARSSWERRSPRSRHARQPAPP